MCCLEVPQSVGKVTKRVKKSQKKVSEKSLFPTLFLRLFDSFRDFLDTPGREARGVSFFEAFWWFSGPEGAETPVNGRSGLNVSLVGRSKLTIALRIAVAQKGRLCALSGPEAPFLESAETPLSAKKIYSGDFGSVARFAIHIRSARTLMFRRFLSTKPDRKLFSGIKLRMSRPTALLEQFGARVRHVENAPACYRAPRWPDPEFPQKKSEKVGPRPKFWNPKKIPQKYRKNTKTMIFGILGVFFGIFGVFSGHFRGKVRESRISSQGVFLRYCS